MTEPLSLTPQIMEDAYRLLRGTRPFIRWKLPDPDDVEFRAQPYTKEEGWYCRYGDRRKGTERHVICVCSRRVRDLPTLLRVLAHEMIHVRDELRGIKSHHGRSFRLAARHVCRIHGFDRWQFGSTDL